MTKPFFPQLPLGDGEPSTAPQSVQPVAGGETWETCPQYHRLFGPLSPDQVMAHPVDGACQSAPCAPLPALCDPSQAEARFFSPALNDVARLRARHLAGGHTLESDAARGWVYFKRLSDEAYRDGVHARNPETRRKRLITAIAILVAQVDCEDFLAQKESSR